MAGRQQAGGMTSLDHPCSVCGYRYASYGKVDPVSGEIRWFCGWRNGECVCVRKGQPKG
jgi:hypothetical protein